LALGNLFGRRTVSRESPVRGHSLYSRALSLPKAAIPSSLGPRPRPPPPPVSPPPPPPRHFALGKGLNHPEFATSLRIKRHGGSFRSPKQLLKSRA
jgi:hypothetical protein